MEKDEIKELCANNLNQEDADRLYETEFWHKHKWTYLELAELQLGQEIGIMPAAVFHTALDNALGRPVYQNELEDLDALYVELCEIRARAAGLYADQPNIQPQRQPRPQPQQQSSVVSRPQREPPQSTQLITEEIEENPPSRFTRDDSTKWVELGRSRTTPVGSKPQPQTPSDADAIARIAAQATQDQIQQLAPTPEPAPAPGPRRLTAPETQPAPPPAPKREPVPWKPASLDI